MPCVTCGGVVWDEHSRVVRAALRSMRDFVHGERDAVADICDVAEGALTAAHGAIGSSASGPARRQLSAVAELRRAADQRAAAVLQRLAEVEQSIL